VRASGTGSLALVSGEAGIGKTSLVRALCDRSDVDVLWGACEPLFTPRPLGPFVDLAEDAGGALAARVQEVSGPSDLASALVQELRRRGPVVLVVEDLHWADEATLDVVRMLARRVESLPVLLVLTYREEGVDRMHPVRVVLGELPSRVQVRLPLAALSPAAVSELAAATAVDSRELAQRTGGNPFFVTEVLAAEGAELPATVRDAVIARAAALGPAARRVLDAVSIVPQRTELWLLEQLAAGADEGLGECLESGMLRSEGASVAFRHEIARVAVEGALPPHERLALHRAALAALAASTERADPARLAHHAEGADDREAVVRYAPAAGERAAALGAHREAAQHFAQALREPEHLDPDRRVQLLERRSYECYLTDQIDEAIDARRSALEELRRGSDPLREGDAHRWLSRLAWFRGDRETAEREAREALELLEPLEPSRELAMAYSNLSQLGMLGGDVDAAVAWGGRAIELAEELDDLDVLVHALNNVGSAEYLAGSEAGVAKVERSLELSLAAGLEEHAARAYTNLGTSGVRVQDLGRGRRYLEEGIAYCRERDLDAWVLYMSGWLARAHLDQGRWDAASAAAAEVLRHPNAATPSRITPLTVVGRLRARRGDPQIWEPLDEALGLARGTRELQRLGPVAGARAEARWLAGELERIAAEVDEALALAVELGEPWLAGELAVWRLRAGAAPDVDPADVAGPWALELRGDPEAAAERWAALGCPYDAALALAACDDEERLRESVEELRRLGAPRAAAHVTRTLRRRGVRGLRAGPRASSLRNPAGLTSRELDVLALVCEGLRNREIAARLFVSQKTVDHHVSAILRKLAVGTRGQAAAEAARLGIGIGRR
jgi:DNA-binding CsgD family transcriptional regulator/tetratricopeptide (TPR) repeat protein